MTPIIKAEMSFSVAENKLKYLLENNHTVVALIIEDAKGNRGKIDAFGKVTWSIYKNID